MVGRHQLMRSGWPRAAGAVAVLWAVGLELPDLHVALLYLAPALLLAILLLAGRYPGEELLVRAARRRSTAGRRRRETRLARRRGITIVSLRGGVLLASGMAGRAPPALTS